MPLLYSTGLLQSPPSSRDSIPNAPPTSGMQTVGEPSNGLSVVIEQLDEECVEIEQLLFETIKQRKVPLTDVLNWIRYLPMTLKAQFDSLIQAQAKTLNRVSSVDELSYILTQYWNAFHPALLEYLVKKLRDEVLKARMDRFMTELQRFRIQTTLGDFLDKWVGEIPPGYQEYILELGERWRERTVEDFEKFQIRLSRSQIVGGGRMSFMKTAKSSSILVILALPKHLFPLNLRQKDVHVFLRDEDVLRVMVDGQCVLDLEELVSIQLHVTNLVCIPCCIAKVFHKRNFCQGYLCIAGILHFARIITVTTSSVYIYNVHVVINSRGKFTEK